MNGMAWPEAASILGVFAVIITAMLTRKKGDTTTVTRGKCEHHGNIDTRLEKNEQWVSDIDKKVDRLLEMLSDMKTQIAVMCEQIKERNT